MKFLIWSWEHLAWWRPARQGYTTNIREAGEYTLEAAAEVVVPHIPPGEEVAVWVTQFMREKIVTGQMDDYRPRAYGCPT